MQMWMIMLAWVAAEGAVAVVTVSMVMVAVAVVAGMMNGQYSHYV